MTASYFTETVSAVESGGNRRRLQGAHLDDVENRQGGDDHQGEVVEFFPGPDEPLETLEVGAEFPGHVALHVGLVVFNGEALEAAVHVDEKPGGNRGGGIVEEVEKRAEDGQHDTGALEFERLEPLERGVLVGSPEGNHQPGAVGYEEEPEEAVDRDIDQGYCENGGDDHGAYGVTEEVALDVAPEKGDSGRYEVLLLVFGPEEALVDLGEEALDTHDQEEELEHPDPLQSMAERGQEVQYQKYGEAEPDTPGEGPGFEPLEGGVFEGSPEGGVEAGKENYRQTWKNSRCRHDNDRNSRGNSTSKNTVPQTLSTRNRRCSSSPSGNGVPHPGDPRTEGTGKHPI